MVRLLSTRGLASVLLVTVPIILLIWQQLTGIFPLRDGTSDAAIFSILMGACICIGFAINEHSPRLMFRNALIGAVGLIGVPMIISGIIAGNDVAQGTNLAEGQGWFFALDVISSPVVEWSFIIQTITALIPIAVIIIGIVMIYLSDSPDEMQTPVIETLVVVGIIVLATLLFGWLGVDLW